GGLGAHDLREVALGLRLVSDESARVDGGHVPGAVLLHQPHHLVVHVGAVLYAGHARNDGALHAFGAMRVRGDGVAVVLRRLDHRADLVLAELRRVTGFRVAQHAAGGGDLDDVAAFLVALAHGLSGVVNRIDHAFGRAGRTHQ